MNHPTQVRYLVLAALCLAALIAYVHRNPLAVPRKSIQQDLALSDAEMDQILSAFYLGYALFQIPGGWLGDRWGTRLILSLALATWSAALGLTALADGFVWLFGLQVFIGMAQACIFPCCVKSFARWFPAAERAFPSGLLGSFMSVGGAMEKVLTGILIGFLTWQGILAIYALPGLVFAVWFATWFRDRPEEHASVNEGELQKIAGPDGPVPAAADHRAPVPWRNLLTSGRLGLICAQQFFRAAAYVFYVTRFPTYLQETFGLTQSDSGYYTSLPLLGVVLGSSSGGVLMDRVLRRTGSRTLSRKGIALGGTLGAAGLLLLAFLMSDFLFAIALITASTFCAGMTGPAGYTITIDQGGRHIATVFSIMNMAGNIGGTLLPVTLGAFVRWTSWPLALVFVASLYVAAAACWAVLPIHGSVVPPEPSLPESAPPGDK